MGVCGVGQCDFGFDDCDKDPKNGCEASLTSVSNCGFCGNACAAPPNASAGCVNGVCGIGQCAANFGDCDQIVTNGCERSLGNDVHNCGACFKVCVVANATPACLGGQCGVGTCNANFNDCNHDPADGCESDRLTDPMNCGACGNACPATANAVGSCVNGACNGVVCKPGFADCDNDPTNGCETDLTMPAHCGSCANVCPVHANASAVCTSGACGMTCNPSFGDCDGNPANGCEQSVAGDLNNCGGCGKVCALQNASPVCTNGQCSMVACNTGFADCDSNPVNGCEVNLWIDDGNCGQCAAMCPMGTSCWNQTCAAEEFPPVYLLYLLESQ
jgi:hypothetical protein